MELSSFVYPMLILIVFPLFISIVAVIDYTVQFFRSNPIWLNRAVKSFERLLTRIFLLALFVSSLLPFLWFWYQVANVFIKAFGYFLLGFLGISVVFVIMLGWIWLLRKTLGLREDGVLMSHIKFVYLILGLTWKLVSSVKNEDTGKSNLPTNVRRPPSWRVDRLTIEPGETRNLSSQAIVYHQRGDKVFQHRYESWLGYACR